MLYKYCSFEGHFFENLKASELYFNIGSEFNDPFDTNLSFISKFANVTSCDVTSMLSSQNPCYDKRIGILSLTEDPSSILMWSYYGTNHTGVCLGLDIADDPRKQFACDEKDDINLKKVIYFDGTKRPNINGANQDISALLKVKSKCWEHEAEQRIIIKNKDEIFPCCVKYDPTILKKIIFGANAKIKDIVRCLKMIKELNLSVEKCISVLDDKEYVLNPEPMDIAIEKELLNFDKIIYDVYHKHLDGKNAYETFEEIMNSSRIRYFMNLLNELLKNQSDYFNSNFIRDNIIQIYGLECLRYNFGYKGK